MRGRFTYEHEGHNSGPYNSRRIHWPGGASGVTIGRGYDMKERSKHIIVNDLTASGISKSQADLIARGAKLYGAQARQFVNTHYKTINEITINQQITIFNRIYPEYERTAKKFFNLHTSHIDGAVKWKALLESIRQVVVDMVYQGAARISTYQAAATNDPNILIANIIKRNSPDKKRNIDRIDFLTDPQRYLTYNEENNDE